MRYIPSDEEHVTASYDADNEREVSSDKEGLHCVSSILGTYAFIGGGYCTVKN